MREDARLPLLPMRPVLSEKIWGGRLLARLYGKAPDDERALGESWEVADLPEGSSTVAGGPLEGKSLGELTRAYGARLAGSAAPAGPFPLLVKIIDAADDLSVQVHPGKGDVARLPGACSKDESWLILRCEPGARLLHGFREGVTRESFRRAIDEGAADRQLREVRVEPGDVVRVAPGTFHAIGRGTLLLEVQEPSDTTFRVWDFGRVGSDGAPRALHVDEALSVGRFGSQPDAKVAPTALGADGHLLLVDAPAYRMERLTLSRGDARTLRLTGSTAVIVVVTRGTVKLAHEPGEEPLVLGALHSAIVPASSAAVLVEALEEDGELVLAGLPGLPLVEAR